MRSLWTTHNEIDYINGLITGKWLREDKLPPDPKSILKLYIKHAKWRRDNGTFGAVFAKKVIKYAEDRLFTL